MIIFVQTMNNPVKNKRELIDRILAHQESIRLYGVSRLGIFGSFVRDAAKPTSDVDFFIEFDPKKKNFDNFMNLAFYLEELTGRKIELVTPQSLNKFIGKHILKHVEYVPLAA